MRDRRGQEQVGVQPLVLLTDLLGERRNRDGVLEQAAEVRMVAGAATRRAPPGGSQDCIAEQRVEQSAVTLVVDLARQVLKESVELVEVAIGRRQEPIHRSFRPIRRGRADDVEHIDDRLVAEALHHARNADEIASVKAPR